MFRLDFFTAFRRRLLDILPGRNVMIYGSCRQCGRCCRGVSLVFEGVRVKNERQFKKLVKRNPEYGRFFINGQSERGFPEFACSWLTPEGTCRDHENRLDICSRFPTRTMYFLGGELPPGCGYRFVKKGKFEAALNKAKKDKNA